jgi:hypothetical protein
LKTRRSRVDRFRDEVRAAPGQIVYVNEFMHPRYQEFCETMPATLGLWLSRSAVAARMSAPLFRRGRQVPTGKVGGFIGLYLLAALRRWRRGTLRYRVEQARIDALHGSSKRRAHTICRSRSPSVSGWSRATAILTSGDSRISSASCNSSTAKRAAPTLPRR